MAQPTVSAWWDLAWNEDVLWAGRGRGLKSGDHGACSAAIHSVAIIMIAMDHADGPGARGAKPAWGCQGKFRLTRLNASQ